MPDIRTVLFDLDGTLIDSIELILASYRHTLAEHGYPAGRGRRMAAGRRARRSGPSWDSGPVSRSSWRRWSPPIGTTTWPITTGWCRPFPGVAELVRRDPRARDAHRGGDQQESRRAPGAGSSWWDSRMRSRCWSVPRRHPGQARPRAGAPGGGAARGRSRHHDLRGRQHPRPRTPGRAAGVLTGAVLWGPFARHELEPAAPDYWLETPEELEDGWYLGRTVRSSECRVRTRAAGAV